MTQKRLRAFAILFALVMLAAACGDNDDDAAPDPADDPADTVAPDPDDDPDDDDDAPPPADGEPVGGDFDHGVTDDTIRVGLLSDLSGIFAPLVVEVVEAWEVYYEEVNEAGGIGGRQVELVVLDQGYDVPRHIEQYQRLRQEGPEGVVMLGHSSGSPHTAAIIDDLEADDMIAHPFTWYSGWADPDFGANAAELYTTYCIESMNAIWWMHERLQEEGRETRLAIISFPGEYGQDGASGAKLAAEALGLEIVYDGEAEVVAGADQTPVISQLVGSDPTLVFATANPTTLAEIFGGVRAQGLDAYWTGTWPTFNFQLMGTDLAEDLQEYYFPSAYTATWGADVDGMDEVVEIMSTRRPSLPTSDHYILGWTQAVLTHQLLEYATSRGDLTRAGIVEAFNDPGFVADFGGLAPSQTWAGEPDDYLVRESYMYELDASLFNLAPISEGDGSTGMVLAEGPFVSPVAEEYTWDGPCFAPQA
jgi:ABC-type branched-subunit amino acid transport system substrate-binding protein